MYLIKREDYDYDEVASAVVAAENVREVRELMQVVGSVTEGKWAAGKATVTLIGTARTKTPQIIHEHYNRGGTARQKSRPLASPETAAAGGALLFVHRLST